MRAKYVNSVILNETYESYNELRLLVRIVINELRNNDFSDKFIGIKDLVGKRLGKFKLLNNFINNEIAIYVDKKEKFIKKEISIESKSVGFFIPPETYDIDKVKNLLINDANYKKFSQGIIVVSFYATNLNSILLHELQHAYDNFRSDGYAIRRKKYNMPEIDNRELWNEILSTFYEKDIDYKENLNKIVYKTFYTDEAIFKYDSFKDFKKDFYKKKLQNKSNIEKQNIIKKYAKELPDFYKFATEVGGGYPNSLHEAEAYFIEEFDKLPNIIFIDNMQNVFKYFLHNSDDIVKRFNIKYQSYFKKKFAKYYYKKIEANPNIVKLKKWFESKPFYKTKEISDIVFNNNMYVIMDSLIKEDNVEMFKILLYLLRVDYKQHSDNYDAQRIFPNRFGNDELTREEYFIFFDVINRCEYPYNKNNNGKKILTYIAEKYPKLVNEKYTKLFNNI